jgi:lysophospholipase L1-like esterase
MPLGDSITLGFPHADDVGGYRAALWARFEDYGLSENFVGSLSDGPPSLGDKDHNGYGGQTIAWIDSNVVSMLASNPNPDFILLNIGANDLAQGLASGMATRLASLLDTIIANSTSQIILSTLVPFPVNQADADTYNAAMPAIVAARASRVSLVDCAGVMNPDDLEADQVHPRTVGYYKMGIVWWNALPR